MGEEVYGYAAEGSLQFYNPKAYEAIRESQRVEAQNRVNAEREEKAQVVRDGNSDFCSQKNSDKCRSVIVGDLFTCECDGIKESWSRPYPGINDTAIADKSFSDGYYGSPGYPYFSIAQSKDSPIDAMTVRTAHGAELRFDVSPSNTFTLDGHMPCSNDSFCKIECNGRSCGFYTQLGSFVSFAPGRLFRIDYREIDGLGFDDVNVYFNLLENGELVVTSDTNNPGYISSVTAVLSRFEVEKSTLDIVSEIFQGNIFAGLERFNVANTNYGPEGFKVWPATGFTMSEINQTEKDFSKISIGNISGEGVFDLSGDMGLNQTNIKINESDGGYAINALLRRGVELMIALAGALTVLFLVWGGLLLLTSASDQGRKEVAMNTIYGSIAALFVISLSHIIVHVLISILYNTIP